MRSSTCAPISPHSRPRRSTSASCCAEASKRRRRSLRPALGRAPEGTPRVDDTGASSHGAPGTVSARSGPRSARRRAGQGLLYAIPTVGVVLAGWAHRNLVEDAFIYLRVVKQLEAGHGPVFNIGQRVEAFTGTIWLFALTLADAVTPARLEWIAVTLGIAATGAGVLLAMLGARRLWSAGDDRPAPWFVPAGALVFTALLPVWVYASDGLENGLAYLWLGLCLWILARWASEPGSAPPAAARRSSSGSAGSCGPSSSSTARCSSGWSCGASRRTARGCASRAPCWRCPWRTRCSAWATSAA